MTENRARCEDLLREALLLQVGRRMGAPPLYWQKPLHQVPAQRPEAPAGLKFQTLLQAALDRGVGAGVLERVLPKRYKQYQKGISGRV